MRASSSQRSVRPIRFAAPLVCLLCPSLAIAQNTVAPATGAPVVAGAPASPGALSTDVWTVYKGDPQRTGASKARVSLPLSLQWRYSSDGPAGNFLSSPLVLGTPGNQRLYFASGSNVMCLDAETGSPVPDWKPAALSGTISTPLAFLSSDDGDLIIAATQGGEIVALRAADGGAQWRTTLAAGTGDAGPVVASTSGGLRVIVTTGEGKLVALTPQGKLDPKWNVSLGRFGNPATSQMTLSTLGTSLFVVATDSRLYQVDVRRGEAGWAVALPNQTNVTPVIAGNNVVVTTYDRLVAYEASSGLSKWSVPIPQRGTLTGSPAFRLVGSVPTLFFGTSEGLFCALDARDGKTLWTVPVGLPFSGAPATLDNMVLAGTGNGVLVALNPRSGAVLWQYRLNTQRLITTGRPGGRGGGRGGFRPSSDTKEGTARFQLVQDDDNATNPPNQGAPGGFPGGGFPGAGGGFPAGGFPGAGGAPAGGGTGATNPSTRQYSDPYGVTAVPTVVNGQVFLTADNAAVYAFTSQTIDADPPRVTDPSIAVDDSAGNLTSLLVNTDSTPAVPGHGRFFFAAGLDDIGSGIDPTSVRVLLDGAPVDAKNVAYDAASGTLTVTLLDPNTPGANLPDGQKTITIEAKDYVGNALSAPYSFFIDNSAPPPAAKSTRPTSRPGGNNNGADGGNGNGMNNPPMGAPPFGGGNPFGGNPFGGAPPTAPGND